MRRRDREVTDFNEILKIVEDAKILHLGLSDDGFPYVVPMNYGYEVKDGKFIFYVHGALEGRKLDIIKKNNKVCVQLDSEGKLIEGKTACSYGYSYYSFMGFGDAEILDAPLEKMDALTKLMKEQTGMDFKFNEKLVSVVSVIKITCDNFTAKHRPLSLKPII